MDANYERALADIRGLAGRSKALQETLREAAKILQRMPKYTGVYFYVLRGDTLELDAFHGRPTAHTHIPVGTGICGTSARTGEAVVVDDVKSDERYLACNTETQSEIVMPIKRGEKYLAQIDVDSDYASAFGLPDRAFLSKVARLLEPVFP